MATEKGNYGDADRTFVILSQIFGAFAHGAGGLAVDGAVILKARDDYDALITRFADKWSDFELAVLESARAMGRLAAHKALHRDATRITVEDYSDARAIIGRLRICPFRHLPAGE